MPLSVRVGDDGHPEVRRACAVVTHTFSVAVEAGELLLGFGKADLESLDFAEPDVHPRFGGPVREIAAIIFPKQLR
jgi:hypothetical protein